MCNGLCFYQANYDLKGDFPKGQAVGAGAGVCSIATLFRVPAGLGLRIFACRTRTTAFGKPGPERELYEDPADITAI